MAASSWFGEKTVSSATRLFRAFGGSKARAQCQPSCRGGPRRVSAPGKRAVGQFAGLPVVGHTGQRPDDAHLVGTAQLSAPPVRPDSGRTATLAVVDRPLSRRLYQARRAIRCSTDRRMFPPIPATGWKPRLKRAAAAAAPGVVGHRSDGLTQPVAIHVNPSI